MKKEIIKLKIQYQVDRENIISALANSGYKVWVEEKEGDWCWEKNYYVCFVK